jgi:hypothetical protein
MIVDTQAIVNIMTLEYTYGEALLSSTALTAEPSTMTLFLVANQGIMHRAVVSMSLRRVTSDDR